MNADDSHPDDDGLSPHGALSPDVAGTNDRGESVDPAPSGTDDGNDLADSTTPADLADTGDTGSGTARRRLVVLLVVTAVVVAGALVALSLRRDDPVPRAATSIPVVAWAPYWTMDRSSDDLDRHGDVLRDVSPFAYEVTAADRIGLPAGLDPSTIESFIDRARAAGLTVTPSIVDPLAEGEMAAILIDPDERRVHVDAIVALADRLDADGVDIDYESFAFVDDPSTWGTTRVAFADFVDELATALDADGRRLSVSVAPVYDAGTTPSSGYWVYDIERLAASVDEIRVMAYGYSGLEPGPVSPITWVERSIAGVVEAAGRRDIIVLGVPLYGTNAPVSAVGDCPDDAPGTIAVTLRTIDDLIARRDARPVFDDETGEWTFVYEFEVDDDDGEVACTQTRRVTYVDAAGARARVDLALENRLGGVALWALGYEDDAFWELLLPVAG